MVGYSRNIDFLSFHRRKVPHLDLRLPKGFHSKPLWVLCQAGCNLYSSFIFNGRLWPSIFQVKPTFIISHSNGLWMKNLTSHMPQPLWHVQDPVWFLCSWRQRIGIHSPRRVQNCFWDKGMFLTISQCKFLYKNIGSKYSHDHRQISILMQKRKSVLSFMVLIT